VSELDGDLLTSFQCRLRDCVENPKLAAKLDFDLLRECSTCVIETVKSAWRLLGSESTLTAVVCEVCCAVVSSGLFQLSSPLFVRGVRCLRRFGFGVSTSCHLQRLLKVC
jgi:hypothetical protein